MESSAPRRDGPALPDSAHSAALRQLAAAAAAYARAARRRVGLPTTRLFVCAHDGAGVQIVRDDLALALCPACAALYAATALPFVEAGQLFLGQGG